MNRRRVVYACDSACVLARSRLLRFNMADGGPLGAHTAAIEAHNFETEPRLHLSIEEKRDRAALRAWCDARPYKCYTGYKRCPAIRCEQTWYDPEEDDPEDECFKLVPLEDWRKSGDEYGAGVRCDCGSVTWYDIDAYDFSAGSTDDSAGWVFTATDHVLVMHDAWRAPYKKFAPEGVSYRRKYTDFKLRRRAAEAPPETPVETTPVETTPEMRHRAELEPLRRLVWGLGHLANVRGAIALGEAAIARVGRPLPVFD